MSRSKRAVGAFFAFVVLALAGPAAGAATAAEPSAQATSPGCGRVPPASGTRTITVGGVSRTYILDVPASYSRSTATPVIFGFHGLGGTGSGFRSYAGLGTPMADYIRIYPSATGSNRAWSNSGDTPFFDAMLTEVSGLLCVNPGRVFTIGHSMGAIFSNHLGCVRGDVLRGIAPVAGAGPLADTVCNGQVAVWIAHGDPDPVVAFSSGVASRDYWLGRNHCSTRTRAVGSGVEYEGCDAGHEVRWVVHGSGHGWPSFIPGEVEAFFTSRK